MRLLLPRGRSIVKQRAGGFGASIVLHAAAIALLILRSAASGSLDSGTPAESISIVAVPEDTLLPFDPAPDPKEADPEEPRQSLELDTFEFDVEKIRRRRHSLFPFLTGDVLFVERVVEKTEVDPTALRNPLGHKPPADRPPLALDAADLQRHVDESWSRRDRWTKFAGIVRLLESHDPQRGQLADLVHLYLDQNLLQPYEDAATRDSKYWVMMELVSDHVDFIDFVRSYSRRYPASRTTTELLFLLDELAQGSLDSLLMLLDTDVATELVATFAVNRDAFGLAANIGTYYRNWLANRGLGTATHVIARYGEMRLRILEAIVASTPDGYRLGDARFLIGQILFNRNDVEGAFRVWRQITPAEGDNYAAAYVQILDALATPGRAAVPQVVGILAGERLRWLAFSRERLRAFGYAFNTF